MLIHLLRLHTIYSLYVSPSLTACIQRFVSLTFILTVFARRRWNKPGDLVTAGHGEQPLPLKNPVPRLDGVTGADRDGSLTWLDLGAELPAGLSVRVSVSLIWDRKEDKHRHSEDLAVRYSFLMRSNLHQVTLNVERYVFEPLSAHLPLQPHEERRCGRLHRGRCWCTGGTGRFPSVWSLVCCHIGWRWICGGPPRGY